MELIFEKSRPGRRGGRVPQYDLAVPEIPPELARARPPRLPEVPENEVVRHFTALADRNFGIDTGFYPLGSCTMKHNPRVNERAAALPGFRDLHPLQEDEGAQGALALMWELQQILIEVAGLPAVTLQPAAGSQGELTGLMLMRAAFADRGETGRNVIVIPDTAHGTNPASVTMTGFELAKVATTDRGNLDLDDLRAKVDDRTAGLMLTIPSSNSPSVEGFVSISPAVRSSTFARRSSRSRLPRSVVATFASSNPVIVTLAGLVPCAVSGITITLRPGSPRSANAARISISPVSSPCEPAAGCSVTAGSPATSIRICWSSHISARAPCAPSSSWRGWRSRNPGSAAARSLTRGLCFIVQLPSG